MQLVLTIRDPCTIQRAALQRANVVTLLGNWTRPFRLLGSADLCPAVSVYWGKLQRKFTCTPITWPESPVFRGFYSKFSIKDFIAKANVIDSTPIKEAVQIEIFQSFTITWHSMCNYWCASPQ